MTTTETGSGADARPDGPDRPGEAGQAGEPGQPAEPAESASPPTSLPPAAEAVVRRRRVQARQKRLTAWQVGATVLFVAVLGALVLVGYQASLRVGGGASSRITDPEAPGYVAEPRPTPTDLYVVTDGQGAFASALVVVPDGSGQGGTAVPLPPSFVVPEYEGSPPMFLGDVYAEGGIDGIRERLGIALGFQIGSAETVPPEALAQLAGGQPVEIENVDNLVEPGEDGPGDVRYPAGPLSLPPEELAGFLGFEAADDPAPNQALRAQAVWEQLLARAEGIDLASLPEGEAAEGSTSPGFGPTVQSLVAGDVAFDAVPMAKVPVPDSYFVAWMPDSANLDGFVARVVPLPQSPAPGIRTPVEVLNGTTDDTATGSLVAKVVGAGGEVTLIGNAESFDVATTTVEYTAGGAETADAIAAAVGGTATEATSPIEGASVRVVVGSDALG